MECAARARGSAGCSPCPGGADGQAHQRRFSKRCLHSSGQHHDARARRGYDVICACSRAGRKYAVAVSAPDTGPVAHSGGGQEAAGAETRAHPRAGFDCASDRRCSRSLE